jgi:hypothetical protein
MRRRVRSCWLAAVIAGSSVCSGCTPVVRYTNALVSDPDRTWFTKVPATISGTVGFVVGVPVDVVAAVPLWFVYRSQPKETRDPISVFLFPSFVLWKAGVLLAAPLDGIEFAVWRSWQPERPLTQEERAAIEHDWDVREAFPEYPVTPIYPPPRPAGGEPRDAP